MLNALKARELLTIIEEMGLVDALQAELFEQWKASENVQLDAIIRIQLGMIDNTVKVVRRLAAQL